MSGAFLQSRQPAVGGCGAASGVLNIRQWFVGVITPDFANDETRQRLLSLNEEDYLPGRTPRSALAEATRTMKNVNEELNSRNSASPPLGLAARIFKPLEPGSIRSCTFSLATTALGAGALALPYAFSLTGIGLGLLTLTLAGLVSALSLQILMVSARYTNTKSYAAVLELSLGSHLASLALDTVVLLNGVGALVCILIFEGDFLPAVLAHPPFIQGIVVSRTASILGAACAVWPLTLSPSISALRFVAIAVPIVLCATIAIVVWDTPGLHREMGKSGDALVWWDFEPRRWLQAVAIMVNAFANHQNAIPCANTLDQPSIARIVKATVNGNILVLVLLASLGIGGYASWGSLTKGDFLLNYPNGLPEIWCCRLMLAIIVYLVLPVALLPTAQSGSRMLLSLVSGRRREVSPTVHAISATTLLCACTLVALKVSNVASVIGVLGGLLAASLMFTFPAIAFRCLLWPTMPRSFRWPCLCAIMGFAGLGYLSVAMKFV